MSREDDIGSADIPRDDPREFTHFDDYEVDSEEYTRLKEIHENALTTFSSPQGSFILAWLYEIVRMGKTTFVPGYPDMSAFNEGKRWVLLRIMQEMHIDDEELFRRAKGVTHNLERTG